MDVPCKRWRIRREVGEAVQLGGMRGGADAPRGRRREEGFETCPT